MESPSTEAKGCARVVPALGWERPSTTLALTPASFLEFFLTDLPHGAVWLHLLHGEIWHRSPPSHRAARRFKFGVSELPCTVSDCRVRAHTGVAVVINTLIIHSRIM